MPITKVPKKGLLRLLRCCNIPDFAKSIFDFEKTGLKQVDKNSGKV